jgi:hypothetical protein
MAGLNLFTNNAATTLASSINSSVTSLTVAASTGGLFPNPTAGQYFYATLQNTTGTTIEIVKVTARSTDTFTIVRAQDNTTASAFTAGDKVELRATAADLNNFGQLDSTNTWALAQTFTSPIAATSGGTAQSTYTTGDIVYASGTNTLSKLAIGTTGQALTVSGGVPAWAAAGGSTSLTTTSFTATAGQTSFTVSYTPSLVQGVYRNGVKLDPSDYTASSGTAVVLSAAAALNDNIQVQFFTALSTLAIPLAVSLGGTGATSLAAATIATQGYTTTATAAGTTTLTVSSTQLQYFTGTTTQTVVLPVASTLTVGQRFEIHNNSTGAVTVQSSGLNSVVVIAGNTTAVVTCILTSGTTAASWDADYTGFTTSVPVANGGTGNTSATAYALLAGGTTTTGAFQSLASVGTSGQILTSNGAGALPTFQTAAGGGGLGGMTYYGFTGTASRSTTVMTVSAVIAGAIKVGDTITSTGGTSFGSVSSFGTGTGGAGTYNMSASGTIASTSIYVSGATFTIPTGKTVLKVQVVGGGGGCGGAANTDNFMGGGGGGGLAIKYLTGLTPGNTLTVTVGNVGVGGTGNLNAPTNGGTGGTSSVASGTQSITTVSATGGGGSVSGYPSLTLNGGSGGGSSGGDLNITGCSGSSMTNSNLSCQGYKSTVPGGWSIFPPQQTATSGPSTLTDQTTSNFGVGANGIYKQSISNGASGASGIVIFEY